MSLHANNVANAVSGTPGTGTITLGSAVSGAQSFASAYGANATVDVFITDGTAWEVARNCTYTHSGTTLSRGTLESSSTGSAVSLTSAAVVRVAATANWGNRLERLLQGITPGGRLTLESGVPVSTTDQTAKTTIYYTPFAHNQILLWDGADWVPTTFTETSLALGTLTNALTYDVFGYLSSGSLVLESLAWTNSTTRATAVTLQDGRYCKSGDKTRLLLGSFYTTSTTTTEDSAGGTTTQVGGKRFLWNVYNQVRRQINVIDTTDSWSYTTNTVRQANNASGNKVEYVDGLGLNTVLAMAYGGAQIASNVNNAAKVGVGVSSATVMSGLRNGAYNPVAGSGIFASMNGAYAGLPGVGYKYLAWLEKGADGSCLFLGDQGGTDIQAGLQAQVMA